MQFCFWFVMAAACAMPALAVPFQMDFTWTAVAGSNGNSADGFAFTFVEPTGQLKITQLSVTLGSGMIYDLTNMGPGYLTWGAYAVNDGGAGSSLLSAPLGEGLAGNRNISWNLTSFIDGVTFGYQSDVDESGTCAAGILGALCRINVDSISPAGFVSRGAVDVSFVLGFVSGGGSQPFSFPSSGQSWDTRILTANTTYSGSMDIPEPATWLLAASGLALLHHRRRNRV